MKDEFINKNSLLAEIFEVAQSRHDKKMDMWDFVDIVDMMPTINISQKQGEIAIVSEDEKNVM